jgi:hypothetical protein
MDLNGPINAAPHAKVKAAFNSGKTCGLKYV